VTDDRPAARQLLANLQRDHATLVETLDHVSGHWGYEDLIYRFWHQSFKVYPLARRSPWPKPFERSRRTASL
jgi:hypothetical protein